MWKRKSITHHDLHREFTSVGLLPSSPDLTPTRGDFFCTNHELHIITMKMGLACPDKLIPLRLHFVVDGQSNILSI